MTPEMLDRLGPFRDEALKRGVPADDVERWIRLARPCATLAADRDGQGPVVGRFGGPVLLPADEPDPWFPLVASIDCAALPEGATDLPLPRDGHLLLFAFLELPYDCWSSVGEVVYVPAGADVTERPKNPRFYAEHPDITEISEAYPQGPLRMTADVSLPYHAWVDMAEPPYAAPLPGHPRSEELVEVWSDTCGAVASDGPFQVGGYAGEECTETDPVVTAAQFAAEAERRGGRPGPGTDPGDAADWVLLADWHPGIDGREGATIHWAIRRDDLAARRFDRAHATFFWNP
ncbi:DUF1963 domain-containing protein [Streptomyces sp. YIM S03343]